MYTYLSWQFVPDLYWKLPLFSENRTSVLLLLLVIRFIRQAIVFVSSDYQIKNETNSLDLLLLKGMTLFKLICVILYHEMFLKRRIICNQVRVYWER